MMNKLKSRSFAWIAGAAVAVAACAMIGAANAQTKEPIKIGFSMSLTGPLAANGKQALLGAKIWEEETNAKGGLLGRPVKLDLLRRSVAIPSTVPGIYTKLLDVDKVDLVVSGYATNMVAPAMPVVIQKRQDLHQPVRARRERRSSNIRNTSRSCRPDRRPSRRSPKASSRSRCSRIRSRRRSRSTYEDAEFSQNACEGARENAKKFGFKIVYDKSYPAEHAPTSRRSCARCRRPMPISSSSAPIRSSSVGMVQAVQRSRTTSRRCSAARMVGLQATVFKNKLGPKLNGIVNYETWVPSEKMMAPAADVLQEVSGRAPRPKASIRSATISAAGAMPISACSATPSTAPRASTTTRSPTICARRTFKTIMGDWSYGAKGEWTKSGMMQVQYHDIKEGADLETWHGMSYQTVLTPPTLTTGKVIYPYEKAQSKRAKRLRGNRKRRGSNPAPFLFVPAAAITSPDKTCGSGRCC